MEWLFNWMVIKSDFYYKLLFFMIVYLVLWDDISFPDKITADTLVTIMENKLAEDETKSDLKRIFGAFDYDNKGFITVSNLKKLADSLELEITDDELQVWLFFLYIC